MSTKSELKENVLASKVETGLKWLINRHVQVLTVSGFVVVGILVGSVFVFRKRQQQEQNWTNLGYAQSLMQQGRLDESRKYLTDLTSNFPRTNAGLYAAFYLGEVDLAQDKIDQAIQHYKLAVDWSGKLPVRPLALVNLGHSYERKGDFDEAARTYQAFMDQYQDHFMAPRVQLALGRAYSEAGKNDEARTALSHLIDLYPTSPWAENARRILDKIESR